MLKNKQWIDNNSKNKIPDRLFTPLHGVRLGESLFAQVFQNNIGFLKRIDLDAALYWFRRRAGKEAPGEPYRGHFEDNIKGQTAGLLLMGAGNALRWADEPDLNDLVDTIVGEIKACSEPDGYLMAVPKEQFGTLEYPHYVRIWLTYGLYAAALGGNPDALDMLRRWQDWFNACDDLPIIRYLVLAFQGVVCSPFVYNTPVGKWDDIENTVQYYQEDWRLGQFIMREKRCIETRKQPGVEPHPHGTELEALEGYLDLYRATGKHYYLRAVLNAYDMYKKDWQHVGGGIVMCEFLDAYPGCAWLSPPRSYNELCCTSFWIFLNQRLHRLFPEREDYVSEIEKSLYNVAIANQDGNEGIRYFAWLDQHKQRGGLVHCCCGVGTRLYAMLPEFLYSVSEDTISVDIYSESEIDWQRNAGEVKLRTRTKMPYCGAVRIEVETEGGAEFELRLRIPSWATGPVDVNVGGEVYTGEPGSYLSIFRAWDSLTELSFDLPFGLRATLYTGAEQYSNLHAEPPVEYARYAFEYGPLLMAVKGAAESMAVGSGHTSARIILNNDPKDFKQWLTPTERPLHFAIQSDEGRILAPYFEIGNDERFTCYPAFALPSPKSELKWP